MDTCNHDAGYCSRCIKEPTLSVGLQTAQRLLWHMNSLMSHPSKEYLAWPEFVRKEFREDARKLKDEILKLTKKSL